jgi:hypothetical protein
MHFRERDQVVQIIRTKYDAAKKKGKNEIIGRMAKANPKISDELAAALTEDERKDVAAWIESHAHVGTLRRELAVRTLQEQMTLAEGWFREHDGEEAKKLAASLLPAWVRLRAVLKKKDMIAKDE